jgi:hypothetical protein
MLDQATMEDYKNKFTVNTFAEDLTQFFPLLHRIMKETSTVDLDQYVEETKEETCKECGMLESSCECDHEKPVKEFSEFADWANKITEGHLTTDIVAKLKDVVGQNIKVGVDGTNGLQTLVGIPGFDVDDDLKNLIKQAGADGDLNTVLTLWLNDKGDEEAIEMLGLNTSSETPEEPAEQPADDANVTMPPPASAPPAAGAPAAAPTPPPASGPPAVTAEGAELPKNLRKPNLKNIAEMVKSFYNKEEGNFPIGEHGVVTKVRKQFGDYAGTLAERLINQIRIPATQQPSTHVAEQKQLEDIIKLAGLKK